LIAKVRTLGEVKQERRWMGIAKKVTLSIRFWSIQNAKSEIFSSNLPALKKLALRQQS